MITVILTRKGYCIMKILSLESPQPPQVFYTSRGAGCCGMDPKTSCWRGNCTERSGLLRGHGKAVACAWAPELAIQISGSN